MTFAVVPDAAWPRSDQRPWGTAPAVRPVGWLGCPSAPTHGSWFVVSCPSCVPYAVSWATWLLFTVVLARCVVLRMRRPGQLGSCSPVCPLDVLCCVCVVLGGLAPVHRCARSVRCIACEASWTTWLLLTGVLARCVLLCMRWPGPLGCCSPVCPLGVLCCMCGVLGHLAPVHRCARLLPCVACAMSWVTWLLFTGVPARCVVLRVRCPGPLGSCSRVCALLVLCSVCGVVGHLRSVHRCACSVRSCNKIGTILPIEVATGKCQMATGIH